MSERVQKMGHLADAKLFQADLRLRIKGTMKAMRENLDEFEDLADLPAHIIAQQGMEMANLHNDNVDTLERIRAIEKALGK